MAQSKVGLIGGLIGGGVVVCVLAGLGLYWLSAGHASAERVELNAPSMVELGQFAAPIVRSDGERGMLLVQARVVVGNQDQSLELSRNMPAVRHGVLREIYRQAGRGEAALSVDGMAGALMGAVNDSYSMAVAEAVYVDRMLVQ